ARIGCQSAHDVGRRLVLEGDRWTVFGKDASGIVQTRNGHVRRAHAPAPFPCQHPFAAFAAIDVHLRVVSCGRFEARGRGQTYLDRAATRQQAETDLEPHHVRVVAEIAERQRGRWFEDHLKASPSACVAFRKPSPIAAAPSTAPWSGSMTPLNPSTRPAMSSSAEIAPMAVST